MKTFNEFLENKTVGAQIKECAEMLSEMDVNPHEYIYESLKKIDPVLAEGWMDGIKSFASNLWTGARQFAGDVAKGAQTGYNRAADTVAGPAAKFDAAERALQDLVNSLKKDERFKNFRSSAQGFKGNVGDYLQRVLDSLRVDKAAVPQLMQTQVKQRYGTRQDAEAQAGVNQAAPSEYVPNPLNAAPQQNNRRNMRKTGS